MKLVDKSGHPLGRQYVCSKQSRRLDFDELVRGYETESGKVVVITDEEFESVAPEMSGDIVFLGADSEVKRKLVPNGEIQLPYG